jgi:hypothetical protein
MYLPNMVQKSCLNWEASCFEYIQQNYGEQIVVVIGQIQPHFLVQTLIVTIAIKLITAEIPL